MGFGLLDAFEKLINEHGSAAILRDHLALVKEAVGKLEKDYATLQVTNTALSEKATRLEAELARHTRRHAADRVLIDICNYPGDAPDVRAPRIGVPIAVVEHWIGHFHKNTTKMLDRDNNITGEGIHYLASKNFI